MANSKLNKQAAAVIVGLSMISFMLDSIALLPSFSPDSSSHHTLRRSLSGVVIHDEKNRVEMLKDHSYAITLGTPPIYPWARNHLRPLSIPPQTNNVKETALFWRIPEYVSGDRSTTITSIFECLGITIADKIGIQPKFGHHEEEDIVAFQPWPSVSNATYVNVDTRTRQGIDQAKRRKLVESGLVDLIVSTDPAYAVEHLFHERAQKGRGIALFQHPVDRLVSKFYYLRSATWEQQYKPSWHEMSLLEWAQFENRDTNYLVKKLAGKALSDEATEEDLRTAMRTITARFIVGLSNKMEESVHRFNVVMGINDKEASNQVCMDLTKEVNVDVLPEVDKGSLARNALVKSNELDVRLYEYIERLFHEQTETIELYGSSIATSNVESLEADDQKEHDLEEEEEEEKEGRGIGGGGGGGEPQEATTGLEEETVSVELSPEEETVLEEPFPKGVVPEEPSTDPEPAADSIEPETIEPEPIESDSVRKWKWKWLWSRS